MTLPRILVIDDQFAKEADVRGKFRRGCGLVKIDVNTSDDELLALAEEEIPIGGEGGLAGAVFTSGQVRVGDSVENSIEEVLRVVRSGWPSKNGWSWSLILLDLQFDSTPSREDDPRFGLRVLDELVRNWPEEESQTGNAEVPVVMLSGYPREPNEDYANRAGARAYVKKEELDRARLRVLLQDHGLLGDPSGNLIGRSHALLKVLREARRVAQIKTGNAMILGPQGSGKSSLALYIHEQSGRGARGGPLIKYFSAPGAKELEYSTLFGYWSGAHSTAMANARGAAEQAHKGTLLIDEVHNLTNETQQQLLQFGRPDAEGRRWLRRLGNFPNKGATEAKDSVRGFLDNKSFLIAVDVLLLSATNERIDDPEWRAAQGFSGPLYQRLAVDYAGEPLRFPSLKRRSDDIPLLFETFLKQETQRIGGRTDEHGAKPFDAEVAGMLLDHSWPGNVAELRGVAYQVARRAKDFPNVIARHMPLPARKPTPQPTPGVEDPAPRVQTANSLDDAARVLSSVQVPHALSDELRGKLALLEEAYARLVKEMLEVTLKQMRAVHDEDHFCLPAFRFLLGKEEVKSTTQAYSKLLSLYKRFKKVAPPDPGSALALAVERAKKNRTMLGRRSKVDGEDEDDE